MEEEGVTLIEYALIAALLAIVSIAVLGLLGTGIRDLFQQVLDAVTGAGG